MHKIPIKGGVGLIFTVGILIIFLLSLPEARWLLALSLPVGIIIAVLLRLTSRD